MQRTPSPNTTPFGMLTVPCRKIESDEPSSFTCVNLRVSPERLAAPVALSEAPPLPTELLQPAFGAPKLPHGQAVAVEPSPKQYAVPGATRGQLTSEYSSRKKLP